MLSFKIGGSEVQDFGNFELSPKCTSCARLQVMGHSVDYFVHVFICHILYIFIFLRSR